MKLTAILLLCGTLSISVATIGAARGLGRVSLAPLAMEDDGFDWTALTPEEIDERIKAERDRVDEAAIDALAERGTREALESLLAAYDLFASTYMRREVLFALGEYDKVPEAFRPALEKLMQVSVGERKRELREAAISTLGRCSENGKQFLKLIVNSTADDTLRERSLAMHIRLGSEEDHEFYSTLYERTLQSVDGEIAEANERKNRNKRKRDGTAPPEIFWPTAALRASAMEAIIDSLSDGDLKAAFKEDRTRRIRRVALQELAERGNEDAAEFARVIVHRVDNRGSDRAIAAKILVDIEGKDAAEFLIDIGIKTVTPVVLSQRIADMLAELRDEDVEKQLVKLIGKGRTPQRAFAIRATKYVQGDKFLKRMRKGLSAKEPDLVEASALALASRGDRESIGDMEKLLEKTNNRFLVAALLESLSLLYDGQNTWLERLETYTSDESDYLRNAALAEIGRLSRDSSLGLMKERLSHPVWSTRMIALRSLAKRRDPSLLKPIVDQMQHEVGRMELNFGDVLFELTGQPFGRSAATWARWLKDQGGKPQLMSTAEVDKLRTVESDRRLKDISSASFTAAGVKQGEPLFFGIRIVSERVLFILDVSGSMAEPLRANTVSDSPETRMDVAKRELASAIDGLPDGAVFNIVPFSGAVMSWQDDGGVPASEDTRLDAQDWLSLLSPMGGTNLYEALNYAFDDPDVDTIYLLSDGEPSAGEITDPQLIRDDIANRNENRGIEIHTIAIGTGLQVLEWLAEDSGGSYFEVQ